MKIPAVCLLLIFAAVAVRASASPVSNEPAASRASGQQRLARPCQFHESGFRLLPPLDEKGAVSPPRAGCRAAGRPGPCHGGACGQPDLRGVGEGRLGGKVPGRGDSRRLRLQSCARSNPQIPTFSRTLSRSNSIPVHASETGFQFFNSNPTGRSQTHRVSLRPSRSPDILSIMSHS